MSSPATKRGRSDHDDAQIVRVLGKPWLFTLPQMPCPFCGGPGMLKETNLHGLRPGEEWSIGCPSAFVPHGEPGYRDCHMHPCSVMHGSRESAIRAWTPQVAGLPNPQPAQRPSGLASETGD